MPKHVLLNNVVHKDLRILTERSAKYGDDVNGALIFPEEFTTIQREYPIFFQKDSQTGEFQAVAIFGFTQNENLFLNDQGWQANYIPAVMEREPFLIGFQQTGVAEEPTPVIHIDIEHPRVSTTQEGEAVFLEYGGNSPYIDRISKTLMLIHEGLDMSKHMFSALLALDLIEPFVLDIAFANGEQYKSQAYYTINQEKFFALDDATLGALHRSSNLHYVYMVIASLGNIKNLIELRNKK
jgi:hypothetical protein